MFKNKNLKKKEEKLGEMQELDDETLSQASGGQIVRDGPFLHVFNNKTGKKEGSYFALSPLDGAYYSAVSQDMKINHSVTFKDD